jgi:hypothetical protein
VHDIVRKLARPFSKSIAFLQSLSHLTHSTRVASRLLTIISAQELFLENDTPGETELMTTNITERRYSDDDLQLAEPHFDEEATMLSARPVVPLTEITEKVEAGSKKHLAFGLSIVASMIIGMVGATLVLKQRWQKPTIEVVETAIAGSGATADDSALYSSSIGEVRGDEAASSDAVENPRHKNAQVRAGSVEQQEPEAVRKIDVSGADEREKRRFERIEARRMSRRAAREEQNARGRRRRPSDDLLRIPEIFEGRHRP